MTPAERLLTLRDEASQLVMAGDYESAYQRLVAAEVLISTMPNQTREQVAMEWRSMQETMARLEKLVHQQRTGRGIQSQRTEIVRPSCD